MRELVVKPGQMAVSGGDAVLSTMALGSSIAVCMYDEKARTGGMVHTLLANSRGEANTAGDCLKYVDTAVEALYQAMRDAGASADNIRVKLAGGARIFCFSEQNPQPDIGWENIVSARKKLAELNLPIVSEDTGENYGRSVHFWAADGKLEIETVNRSRYRI